MNDEKCGWCIEGICRLGKDKEKDCDWSSIPYTKEGISKRMDKERENLIQLSKEVTQSKEWAFIKEKIKTMTDIIKGLDTMSTVLEHEFGTYKKISDPIFQVAFTQAIIHSKLIEKKEQRKKK